MIGTLARSGQGSYTTGNVREYDAWGSVRSGQTTGDPKGRYCASLGHKTDDESGLVYMRARYYESTSGRFVSEDPSCQGTNLFTYCFDNPVGGEDPSGEWIVPDTDDLLMAAGFLFAMAAAYNVGKYDPSYMGQVTTGTRLNIAGGCGALAVAAFACAQLVASGLHLDTSLATKVVTAVGAISGLIQLMTAGAKAGSKTFAYAAVIGVYTYGLALEGELIADICDPSITG